MGRKFVKRFTVAAVEKLEQSPFSALFSTGFQKTLSLEISTEVQQTLVKWEGDVIPRCIEAFDQGTRPPIGEKARSWILQAQIPPGFFIDSEEWTHYELVV